MCICFGVTDTQVAAQIENGARSMREIAASCRAGTDCGRCVKTITAMLPRDDTRACDGCTKRCGRICRADRVTSAEPAAAPSAPVIAVTLSVVQADAENAAPAA
jgi:bacterioferritin-associated ferredoxin